jgi:hypothetical protein
MSEITGWHPKEDIHQILPIENDKTGSVFPAAEAFRYGSAR